MSDPILTRARELIADPEHWTKHTLARNPDGKPISPFNPAATCWCAEGALVRAVAEHTNQLDELASMYEDEAIEATFGSVYYKAGNLLHEFVTTPYGGYIDFNDDEDTTHAAILGLFDAAIAASRPGVEL